MLDDPPRRAGLGHSSVCVFICRSHCSFGSLMVHTPPRTMPQAPLRPRPEEIASIQQALITLDLSPGNRRRLRMVLAWAEGKSTRAVAADSSLKASDFTVRQAIAAYRRDGLTAFTRQAVGNRGGRAPVSKERIAAIVSDLKASISAGTPLPYRVLQSKHGPISLGKLAQIARAAGLDASRRRGPVAPRS